MLSVKLVQLERQYSGFKCTSTCNGNSFETIHSNYLLGCVLHGRFYTRLDQILAVFSCSLSIDTIVITALSGQFKNAYT